MITFSISVAVKHRRDNKTNKQTKMQLKQIRNEMQTEYFFLVVCLKIIYSILKVLGF